MTAKTESPTATGIDSSITNHGAITYTGGGLEQPDTNNATIIGWYKGTDVYNPDQTWLDDRYPRRYGDYYLDKDLTNNGYKNGVYWNKKYYRWLESDCIIRTCSAQLPLTRQERASAKSLFHRLQGEDFGTYKEIYAVATCIYVIENEEEDLRRGHPNVPEKNKPAELRLENVGQQFKITEKWLRRAYARIERWVRLGELGPRPEFDKYDEEVPLEYQHRIMEVIIQETE